MITDFRGFSIEFRRIFIHLKAFKIYAFHRGLGVVAPRICDEGRGESRGLHEVLLYPIMYRNMR